MGNVLLITASVICLAILIRNQIKTTIKFRGTQWSKNIRVTIIVTYIIILVAILICIIAPPYYDPKLISPIYDPKLVFPIFLIIQCLCSTYSLTLLGQLYTENTPKEQGFLPTSSTDKHE